MSEDLTRNLTVDEKLNLILARIATFAIRFDSLESRLETLAAKSYDTRPVWERALKEILETRAEIGEVKEGNSRIEKELRLSGKKVEALNQDTLSVRAEIGVLNERLDHSEMPMQ